MADSMRYAFLNFYVGRAMEPQLAQRATDMDGSFRYLNDTTLASFTWLFCSMTEEERHVCLSERIEEFPVQFLETSPVFYDFAPAPGEVEWPDTGRDVPLACVAGRSDAASGQRDEWFSHLDVQILIEPRWRDNGLILVSDAASVGSYLKMDKLFRQLSIAVAIPPTSSQDSPLGRYDNPNTTAYQRTRPKAAVPLPTPFWSSIWRLLICKAASNKSARRHGAGGPWFDYQG